MEVEVEFCIDLNCFFVFDVVVLVGFFNNFNLGVDFLMQDMGNCIYCKILELDLGVYDFKFFFVQEQFEDFNGVGVCVVSFLGVFIDGFVCRIIVEEGMF